MSVSPLSVNKSVSLIPLEQLAKNPDVSQPDKIAVVAQQFESYLLRTFLGEARKSLAHSSCALGSGSQQIYQDMVTAQMADNISKSGSFGLGSMLQAQLERQNLKDGESTPVAKTETKR